MHSRVLQEERESTHVEPLSIFALLLVVSTACSDPPLPNENASETGATKAIASVSEDKKRVVVPNGFGWFPSESRFISWYDKGSIAPLLILESALGEDRPKCWSTIAPKIEMQYQVIASWPGEAVNLFKGRFDRDESEECVRQVFAALGVTLAATRDKAVTLFRASEGKAFYLSWALEGFVVWGADRSMVERFGSLEPSIQSNERMMYLASQTAPGASTWTISTGDFSSAIIGVASLGFVMGTTLPDGPTKSVRSILVLYFQSDELAKNAELAIRAKANDGSLKESIASWLNGSVKTASNKTVEIDLVPLMKDQETSVAIQQFLTTVIPK